MSFLSKGYVFCFEYSYCEYNLFLYVLYVPIMKNNKKTGINAGNVSNSKINDRRLITGSL
ncbi:hypothetical protein CFSAN000560_13605 [Salmonella enterica subsp. arizonae str. CFSAN000560]|nr:hypothetical protein [Salmonella enterica subsp. arizonae serovar 62:z36:-]ECG1412794.1 hypothetical protein [Salmonella enterica subsp. arizonae str. CFSAN000560]ECG8549426.1 hypothetical protein [Salmonella enterica subsp. arizonae]HAF0497671.1 hypothetical protein [Salmonella enterica subsp. arizonae serovar 62:z36:-]